MCLHLASSQLSLTPSAFSLTHACRHPRASSTQHKAAPWWQLVWQRAVVPRVRRPGGTRCCRRRWACGGRLSLPDMSQIHPQGIFNHFSIMSYLLHVYEGVGKR
ncbi:hypothetical protein E2C01_009682 [Portunus trituberculatus]|uniref:Uncharacterized protein n=1 Tax=Portunus trituberculatus TaxID=210409 RepID=A0A5B7D6F2_PORTR|nr:hypothetical protein [Portunus trituberculatus]